jgi:hypothetical protein
MKLNIEYIIAERERRERERHELEEVGVPLYIDDREEKPKCDEAPFTVTFAPRNTGCE